MIQDVSLRTVKEERAITIEQQRKDTLHIPEPFEKEARARRYQEAVTNRNIKTADETNPKKSISDSNTLPALKESPENKAESVIPSVLPESGNEKINDNLNSSLIPEPDLSDTGEAFTKDKTELPQKSSIVTSENAKENISDISKPEQMTLEIDRFLSEKARPSHRLIGQVFRTYWMIEYDDKLYIVDQHAAHEKVMFERLMKQLSEKKVISQQLLPPKVLHLNSVEHGIVMNKLDLFLQTGFDIEDFGDDSIVIRSMPDDIMGVDPELLFDALLNALVEDIGKVSLDFFVEKLSSMACKAAIKGNWAISAKEADTLIDELLTLDNPYNCPHGRPTMIALTKTELERKFKRIQD